MPLDGTQDAVAILAGLREDLIEPAGNTALLGAKIAIFQNRDLAFAALTRRIQHVPLGADSEFQEQYVAAMLFSGRGLECGTDPACGKDAGAFGTRGWTPQAARRLPGEPGAQFPRCSGPCGSAPGRLARGALDLKLHEASQVNPVRNFHGAQGLAAALLAGLHEVH